MHFNKRSAKEFSDAYEYIIKLLFTSLSRPILVYSSVLWSLRYEFYSEKLESIQREFHLESFTWSLQKTLGNFHFIYAEETLKYTTHLKVCAGILIFIPALICLIRFSV